MAAARKDKSALLEQIEALDLLADSIGLPHFGWD